MLVNKKNERLISRIVNQKYGQATCYLKKENKKVVALVKAMSDVFGNCGTSAEYDDINPKCSEESLELVLHTLNEVLVGKYVDCGISFEFIDKGGLTNDS